MIALLNNPDRSTAMTASMVRIAREAEGPEVTVQGFTVPIGARPMTDPSALAEAKEVMVALAPPLSPAAAVITAAFQNPRLLALRDRFPISVTGIEDTATCHGHKSFTGTSITAGDPVTVTKTATALRQALAEAFARAVSAGADAIAIRGGPLAKGTRSLSASSPVALIEPLQAAVRLNLARFKAGTVQ